MIWRPAIQSYYTVQRGRIRVLNRQGLSSVRDASLIKPPTSPAGGGKHHHGGGTGGANNPHRGSIGRPSQIIHSFRGTDYVVSSLSVYGCRPPARARIWCSHRMYDVRGTHQVEQWGEYMFPDQLILTRNENYLWFNDRFGIGCIISVQAKQLTLHVVSGLNGDSESAHVWRQSGSEASAERAHRCIGIPIRGFAMI